MPRIIAHIIETVIKPPHAWHYTLVSHWHTIMGNLSTKAIIDRIEGNIVTLGVYDACWLQELYLLAPILRDRLNQMLDQPYIKELRFKRTGKKRKSRLLIKTSAPTPLSAPIILTNSEQHALKKIDDPVLKEVLIAFRSRCQRSV